jgi:hypothetical protein
MAMQINSSIEIKKNGSFLDMQSIKLSANHLVKDYFLSKLSAKSP